MHSGLMTALARTAPRLSLHRLLVLRSAVENMLLIPCSDVSGRNVCFRVVVVGELVWLMVSSWGS